ncbi:MAG: hypothetical protein ACM3NH_02740 [Candidatus Saccharibacteria bacterium]
MTHGNGGNGVLTDDDADFLQKEIATLFLVLDRMIAERRPATGIADYLRKHADLIDRRFAPRRNFHDEQVFVDPPVIR